MKLREVEMFEMVRESDKHGLTKSITKKSIGFGLFHQWGCDFEEYESDTGNYTVAIIEKANGEIVTPTPDRIRFTGKYGELK